MRIPISITFLLTAGLVATAYASFIPDAQEFDRNRMITTGRIIKQGNGYSIVTSTGEIIPIARVGGQARKTVEQAVEDGGIKYILFTEGGGRIVISYADGEKPLTPAEESAQKREAIKGLLDARTTMPLPTPADKFVWWNPRGNAVVSDGEIVQQLPDNTGRDRSDKASPVVIGRFLFSEVFKQIDVLPALHYPQTLTLELKDPAKLKNVIIIPTPLYEGNLAAYLCRWDDNNGPDNVRTSLASSETGVYGTCFANGMTFSWPIDPTINLTTANMRTILQAGYSIGNHSMSHNANGYLETLSNSEQFIEVYLPRAEREAMADCTIMTVAPPHNKYGDGNTMENWRNAGHYSFIVDAPGTRGYSANNVLIVRKDTEPLQVFPAFHASNLRSDSSRERAVEQWKKFSSYDGLWKCNFNQYSAYRYQYYHTIQRQRIHDNKVVLELLRPCVIDLNDAIPLTYLIKGVSQEDIFRLSSNGEAIAMLTETGNGVLFNLPHAPNQQVPKAIGVIYTDAQTGSAKTSRLDADWADIETKMSYAQGKLSVTVSNASGSPLNNVSLTYRLPNQWSRRVVRTAAPDIAVGATWSDSLTVSPEAFAMFESDEIVMLAAQLDFVNAGKYGRLHLVLKLSANLLKR